MHDYESDRLRVVAFFSGKESEQIIWKSEQNKSKLALMWTLTLRKLNPQYQKRTAAAVLLISSSFYLSFSVTRSSGMH